MTQSVPSEFTSWDALTGSKSLLDFFTPVLPRFPLTLCDSDKTDLSPVNFSSKHKCNNMPGQDHSAQIHFFSRSIKRQKTEQISKLGQWFQFSFQVGHFPPISYDCSFPLGRYESVIFLNRPKPVNRNSRPWQLQLWSLQPDIRHNHCREGRWKDPHGLRRTKFAVLRKASETLTRKSGSSSDDFTLETPYRTASGASTHTREQRK